MLFNSFEFLLGFLPITYVVFWMLKTARARYAWLALTGYVFYGFWDARFTVLMAFSTLVSYLAGLGFLRWTDPRRRKLCLVVPIVGDLALLGFFKYANFTMSVIRDAAASLGTPVSVPHLDIILPIGISFYTFHTISYIVDCYRGVVRPTRNLFEFAAYVSLFSQLVAGPIVRFRQIEEDLENLGHADRTRWLGRGISFFVIGLVEKVVLADALAAFVDPAFAQYAALSTGGAWLAVLGYTFQLYFDFCGYSDMAVGLGLMFGLRIPQNFNSPYKALDPSDFWRRWHISLSMCLRDYLYIPLGGNRGTERRTYINLLLTMLIGGLWHGANWTFIIWGAYHGLLLAAYRRFARLWDPLPALVRQVSMFALATIGWVWFRAPTLGAANILFQKLFAPASGVLPAGASVGLVAFGLAIAVPWAMGGLNAHEIVAKRPYRLWRAVAVAAAFGAVIAIMAGSGSSPFLYFQF